MTPEPVVDEQLTPDDVLADVGGVSTDQSGGSLTPTQRAGLKLAVGVGAAIGVVIVAVIIDYLVQAPKIPSELTTRANANLADPTIKASFDSLLQNYTAVHGLAVDRATKLFDLVVVKALLPVFTTILGYIFGSRAAGAGS